MGDLEPVILDIVSKLSSGGGSATLTKQNTIITDVAVVNALVDAIKAKTDNLPTDPADESLLEAAIADLITRAKGLDDIYDGVAAISAGDATAANQATIIADVAVVDALVDAIKASTDNLPIDPADESLLEAAIADLISRTKGLDDIHDDVGTVDGVADAIITDTEKIYDVSIGLSPADGSLASFIATGGTALGTRLPASTSLYGILGTGYKHDNGNFTHSIRRHLRLGLAGANATTVLAENKSILDALGHNGTTDIDTGIMAQLQDYVTDDAASIYGRLGAFTGPVGGAAQDDNVKASLDLAHTDLDSIKAKTDTITAHTDNNFSTSGATNFFASAQPAFTINQDTRYDLTGIAIDISAFTAGALITLQVQRATAASGASYKDYRPPINVVPGTDPDLIEIPDLTGMYSYTRVTAKSDNAADTAVDVPIYWTRGDLE